MLRCVARERGVPLLTPLSRFLLLNRNTFVGLSERQVNRPYELGMPESYVACYIRADLLSRQVSARACEMKELSCWPGFCIWSTRQCPLCHKSTQTVIALVVISTRAGGG